MSENASGTHEYAIWSGLHMDEWHVDKALELLLPLPQSILGLTVVAQNTPFFRKKLGLSSDELLPRMIDDNPVFCFGRFAGASQGAADAAFFEQMTAGASIWDIHGNNNNRDIPFYGPQSRHDDLVLGIASLLGSDNALICPPPHVAGLLPRYVGWDLGRNSPNLRKIPDIARRLCEGDVPPARPMKEWRVIGGISKQNARRLHIAKLHEPFAPLPFEIYDVIETSRPFDHSIEPHAIFSDNEQGELYPKTKYHCEVIVPCSPEPVL